MGDENTSIGAQSLIKEMKHQGVKSLFGYPGESLSSIYEELFNSKNGLKHIMTRHEQAACYAADAYARISGQPGIVLASSGPGATNLVTGIANSHMDSIPLVCLTGQVPTYGIGVDYHQEVDIKGITAPIVKHSYVAKDSSELSKLFANAFYISKTGRPGPTLIDLPKDILEAKIENGHAVPDNYQPDIKGYKPRLKGNQKQISLAAKKIINSRRPVLYVGGGVVSAGASDLVMQLVDQCKLPITTTMMAKGVVPYAHESYLGMLGQYGTAYANYAIYNCDLLIAIGVRFDNRSTGRIAGFAPDAEVVHIDIDPAEIGKNYEMKTDIDIPIVGDASIVLKELLEEIGQSQANTDEWFHKISEWKEDFPFEKDPYKEDQISPQSVFASIAKHSKDKVVYVTDVGEHQLWASHYAQANKPKQWITSGGAGTMGYGLPAAIGTAAALKDSKGTDNDRSDEVVVNIVGDGGFQMSMAELATCKSCDLPVINCIFNNDGMSLIESMFTKAGSDEIASQNGSPDFVKLAESFGVKAARPTTRKEFETIIKEAIASKETWVIDIPIPSLNIWPVKPPEPDSPGFREYTLPPVYSDEQD